MRLDQRPCGRDRVSGSGRCRGWRRRRSAPYWAWAPAGPSPKTWLAVLTALACSVVAPGAAARDDEAAAQAPPPVQVIVLKPMVRFGDVRSTADLPDYSGQELALESRLLDAARRAIGSRMAVVDQETIMEPAAAEACTRLQALSSRLARGNITDEAREDLGRLAAIDDRQLVLVHFLRVKVGPGASWNPWNGTITSSTSSTLVQAALLSCDTGQLLWKNEQLIRKAVRPDSKELAKALVLLYGSLETK